MKNIILKIIVFFGGLMYLSICNLNATGQDVLKAQNIPETPNHPTTATITGVEESPESEITLSSTETFDRELLFFEIADKLISFNNQLLGMQEAIQASTMEKLNQMDKQIAAIDVKWNLFNESNQIDIANSDSLLQIAANFQLIKQSITDSINVERGFLEAKNTLSEAEDFLFSQDTVYTNLYDEGKQYSFVQKLTPLLEKLKVKEQLIFTEIQTAYDNSKEASTNYPVLQRKFQKIEGKYIELKTSSDKIQALEYKTLFQRIKDYLLGLAAVAMILMFINLIMTKIKVWKQGVESAKKMKELFKQNDNEYPTI